jgi:class 3 adenylate cyclase
MNSQSPPSIHYEVYTQDGGSRWNLHARYERNERDAAILDAKNVEKNLQIPAKVVRETYYPANNQSEDTLVYAGDPGLRAKMLARANSMPRYRGGGAGRSTGSGQLFKAQLPVANPAAAMGSTAKFLIVVAASLTVAATVTGIVNASLDPLGGQITDFATSFILFATFMVTFVAVALPLSTSLLNWRMFGLGASKPRQSKPVVMPPMPKPSTEPPPPEEIEVEEELDWEDLKDEDEALPPIEGDDEDDGPVPEPAPEATPEPQAAAEEQYDTPQESPATIFVRFVNALTAAVRRRRPTLDAYNMFGVDLVMAGAIDVLGQQSGMPTEERRALLKRSIEAMGVKPATAQAFADRYEDYLGEPRYLPMILAGRSTMESFLGGQDLLQDSMGPVFEQWNKPQAQAASAASRIMTVMFTDMVGSTDMTQAQGDRAAQYVVRRHNTIVRNALAQYSGKEIKHTGDGIMASFSSAASGVEAAIAIQRSIHKHNSQTPEQALHIRIGINAGEPIEEEEDLFGTTVQLAARVCARCDTDAIVCSNVVKELATGRGLGFTSLGAQELKGFKEEVVLYEVAWRE